MSEDCQDHQIGVYFSKKKRRNTSEICKQKRKLLEWVHVNCNQESSLLNWLNFHYLLFSLMLHLVNRYTKSKIYLINSWNYAWTRLQSVTLARIVEMKDPSFKKEVGTDADKGTIFFELFS